MVETHASGLVFCMVQHSIKWYNVNILCYPLQFCSLLACSSINIQYYRMGVGSLPSLEETELRLRRTLVKWRSGISMKLWHSQITFLLVICILRPILYKLKTTIDILLLIILFITSLYIKWPKQGIPWCWWLGKHIKMPCQ